MSHIKLKQLRPRYSLLLALIVSGGWARPGMGDPFSDSAEHYLRQAEEALQRSDYSLGRNCIRKSLANLPTDPSLHLRAARIARRLYLVSEAQDLLTACGVIGGNADEIMLEHSLLAVYRGELAQVEKRLLELLRIGHPEPQVIFEALAVGCLDECRWKDARRYLDEWARIDPKEQRICWLRAELAEAIPPRPWGRSPTADALAQYLKVVQQDNGCDLARLRAATLLTDEGNYETALPHWYYLNKHYPLNPHILLGIAQCHRGSGRDATSFLILLGLVAGFPNYGPGYAELGSFLMHHDHDHLAVLFLAKAVIDSPRDASLTYRLAICLQLIGQKRGARMLLERFSLIAKEEAHALRLREAIADHPTDPSLRYEMGVHCLGIGQHRHGVAWFRKALRLDPLHVPSHRALAAYYERAGRPDLAAKHRQLAK
jgi:tetratricopeptide (TPR) repeat protein